MRAFVALVALGSVTWPGCLIIDAPPDGEWSPITKPCVSAGAAPRQLARDGRLDYFVPGGDTILYNSSGMIKQVRVAGGEPEIVAIAYNDGPFEVFDNNLVYVAADDRSASVVLDRGLRAETRWERIGPSETSGVLDFLAIPAGVYWSDDPTKPGYRWHPTDGLTRFDLRAYASLIKTDGTTFFYSIDGSILVTKPVTGGVALPIAQDVHSTPIAIDATEVYYSRLASSGMGSRELVALSRSNTNDERIVARGNINDGTLGGGFVYWAEFDRILRRVSVAGGAVEMISMGTALLHDIDLIVTDACNVYWTEQDFDGRTLHARSH